MRIAIVTPAEIMPNKIPGLECECQNRPVDLALEPAFITWIKKTGEEVKEGEGLLEGECQKRIITIPAPCTGVLAQILIEDGGMASPGEILGFIETGTKEQI